MGGSHRSIEEDDDDDDDGRGGGCEYGQSQFSFNPYPCTETPTITANINSTSNTASTPTTTPNTSCSSITESKCITNFSTNQDLLSLKNNELRAKKVAGLLQIFLSGDKDKQNYLKNAPTKIDLLKKAKETLAFYNNININNNDDDSNYYYNSNYKKIRPSNGKSRVDEEDGGLSDLLRKWIWVITEVYFAIIGPKGIGKHFLINTLLEASCQDLEDSFSNESLERDFIFLENNSNSLDYGNPCFHKQIRPDSTFFQNVNWNDEQNASAAMTHYWLTGEASIDDQHSYVLPQGDKFTKFGYRPPFIIKFGKIPEAIVSFYGLKRLQQSLWELHQVHSGSRVVNPLYFSFLEKCYRFACNLGENIHVPLRNIESVEQLPISSEVSNFLGQNISYKGLGLELNLDRIFVREKIKENIFSWGCFIDKIELRMPCGIVERRGQLFISDSEIWNPYLSSHILNSVEHSNIAIVCCEYQEDCPPNLNINVDLQTILKSTPFFSKIATEPETHRLVFVQMEESCKNDSFKPLRNAAHFMKSPKNMDKDILAQQIKPLLGLSMVDCNPIPVDDILPNIDYIPVKPLLFQSLELSSSHSQKLLTNIYLLLSCIQNMSLSKCAQPLRDFGKRCMYQLNEGFTRKARLFLSNRIKKRWRKNVLSHLEKESNNDLIDEGSSTTDSHDQLCELLFDSLNVDSSSTDLMTIDTIAPSSSSSCKRENILAITPLQLSCSLKLKFDMWKKDIISSIGSFDACTLFLRKAEEVCRTGLFSRAGFFGSIKLQSPYPCQNISRAGSLLMDCSTDFWSSFIKNIMEQKKVELSRFVTRLISEYGNLLDAQKGISDKEKAKFKSFLAYSLSVCRRTIQMKIRHLIIQIQKDMPELIWKVLFSELDAIAHLSTGKMSNEDMDRMLSNVSSQIQKSLTESLTNLLETLSFVEQMENLIRRFLGRPALHSSSLSKPQNLTNSGYLDGHVAQAYTNSSFSNMSSNSPFNKNHFYERLHNIGLSVFEVKEDKNTQFRALAYLVYKIQSAHSLIRNLILVEILSKPSMYSKCLDPGILSIHEYVRNLSKEGIDGDHITLTAFSNFSGMEIIIFSPMTNNAVAIRSTCSKKSGEIYLIYLPGGMYHPLKTEVEEELEDIPSTFSALQPKLKKSKYESSLISSGKSNSIICLPQNISKLKDICISRACATMAFYPKLSNIYPEELVQKILKKLCSSASLERMDLDISLRSLLHEQIFALNFRKCPLFTHLSAKEVANSAFRIQKLCLAGCVNVNSATIISIVQVCHDLVYLDIKDCHINDSAVESIAHNCPNLQFLDLSNNPLLTNNSILPLNICKHLHYFIMKNCTLSDNSFKALPVSLTSVDFSGSTRLSDRFLLYLRPIAAQLTELKLSSKSFSDGPMALLLQMCTKLQGIEIIDSPSVGDRALLSLGTSCLHMKRLSLAGCKSVTDAGFAFRTSYKEPNSGSFQQKSSITDFSSFKNASMTSPYNKFGQLESVDLNGCFSITDKAIMVIAHLCQRLKDLDLTHCFLVSDLSLVEVSRWCRLRKLRIGGCNRVTDVSLESIAISSKETLVDLDIDSVKALTDRTLLRLSTYCVNLRFFNCSHFEHFSSRGLSIFFSSCTMLHSIVAESSSICDESVSTLAQYCKRVRVLKLGYCEKITNISLRVIKNCSSIKVFDLSYCSQLSPGLFAAISCNLQKLRHFSLKGVGIRSESLFQSVHPTLHKLDLSWNAEISDTAVISVAKNCPNLEFIDLNRCPFVSSMALRHLCGRCKYLRIIKFAGCKQIDSEMINYLYQNGMTVYN